MRFLILFLLIVFSTPAFAQDLGQASDLPVEISAQNSLEWLRDDKKYVANGDVIVTQGDLTLKTDQLTAEYVGGDNSTDITLLTATGNVVIQNADSTLTGEEATYDLITGQANVIGENLKLVSQDQEITASEKMEFNTQTNVARAVGNAVIKSDGNTLKAKTIEATFAEDGETSNLSLANAKALGGVTILTGTETLTGNSGYYNAANNTANVTGNVVIKRGKNSLEGQKATVNLTTNISQIIGGDSPNERVKGIFYPKENQGS